MTDTPTPIPADADAVDAETGLSPRQAAERLERENGCGAHTMLYDGGKLLSLSLDLGKDHSPVATLLRYHSRRAAPALTAEQVVDGLRRLQADGDFVANHVWVVMTREQANTVLGAAGQGLLTAGLEWKDDVARLQFHSPKSQWDDAMRRAGELAAETKWKADSLTAERLAKAIQNANDFGGHEHGRLDRAIAVGQYSCAAELILAALAFIESEIDRVQEEEK